MEKKRWGRRRERDKACACWICSTSLFLYFTAQPSPHFCPWFMIKIKEPSCFALGQVVLFTVPGPVWCHRIPFTCKYALTLGGKQLDTLQCQNLENLKRVNFRRKSGPRVHLTSVAAATWAVRETAELVTSGHQLPWQESWLWSLQSISRNRGRKKTSWQALIHRS